MLYIVHMCYSTKTEQKQKTQLLQDNKDESNKCIMSFNVLLSSQHDNVLAGFPNMPGI